MRVLVLGGNGMIGHRLCHVLSKRMDVWATVREHPSFYKRFELMSGLNLLGNINVQDFVKVQYAIESLLPEVVINAVGIVKQRRESKEAIPSIQVNALFPHKLAHLCGELGIRVIQISTDCVFSGRNGNYSEIDEPDPIDLYGRTKLLGELHAHGTLTLRTSVIGWQLSDSYGLLNWLSLQRGKKIPGYRKAIFSGLTTTAFTTLISDIIEFESQLQGLYHVASIPVSKYDLLIQLQKEFGWDDISISPDDEFVYDRSLDGSTFTSKTNWSAPSWKSMIKDLVKERYV